MFAWLKRIFDRSADPVHSCNLYRDKEAGSCAYVAGPLYALSGAQAQPAPSRPEVTDAMALAFHHALTDGSIGAREVEEIKDALRAALAAAPKLEGE